MANTKKQVVPVDCRDTQDRRQAEDRRKQDIPVANDRRTNQRRKVQRRRQIDPTTCERDYTEAEIEFMHALDAYKRANGRMFPTCSEILEVIRDLGYVRVEQDELVADELAATETVINTDTTPLPLVDGIEAQPDASPLPIE